MYDPKREWRGWPGTVTEVSQIADKLKNPDIDVIVFHPQGDKRAAFTPLADFVTKLHQNAMAEGWDKTGKHFTFLVDEAVNVSTARWVDEKLLALIAENRPEILDIYLTFQSPKDVNNLLKSRVDTWFVFATSLPSDMEYLNKEIGVPEEDVEEIAHLPEHEFAQFHFDGGRPSVEFIDESEEWFRPLEYFELNAGEREEIKDMARDDRKKKEALQDLLEDLADWKDRIIDWFESDDGGEPPAPRGGRERVESRREREPRRERERSGGLRW